MMKKLFFLLSLSLFTNCLFANSTYFEDRQTLIKDIRTVIQDEEAIATAYEEYIINEMKLPSSMIDLTTSSYLGALFSINFTTLSAYFRNYSLDDSLPNEINYRLKTNQKIDTKMKALYDSDTFRKKTFVYNGKVKIILESDLAKNLYSMIQKSPIFVGNYSCENGKEFIFKENQIFVCDTNSPYEEIMYYHIDNYKKGPIVISDDISYYDLDVFKSITPGTLMYGFTGQKYVKTIDDIKKIQ